MAETMTRGDVVCFRAIVSNYGHIQHMPVVVLGVGPKRVRVQTLDLRRNRTISVKPENLHPLASTEFCPAADTSPFLGAVEQIARVACGEGGGTGMKITLESTDKIVTLNGVPARIWQGTTESGVPCHAYITRVGVDRTEDTSEFERELRETATPRAELATIPLRMVL